MKSNMEIHACLLFTSILNTHTICSVSMSSSKKLSTYKLNYVIDDNEEVYAIPLRARTRAIAHVYATYIQSSKTTTAAEKQHQRKINKWTRTKRAIVWPSVCMECGTRVFSSRKDLWIFFIPFFVSHRLRSDTLWLDAIVRRVSSAHMMIVEFWYSTSWLSIK